MFQVRKSNMFLMCVAVGLVFLTSKYRNNVLRSVKDLCHSAITDKSKKRKDKKDNECNVNENVLKVPLGNVILADSPEKCDYAVQRIRW